MKVLKFISATILASAIGVVAGMLLAPNKGSRTRRKISELSHDYNDYLSDKYNDFVDSFSDSLENLQDDTLLFAKKAKTKANKIAPKINSDLM